MDPSPEHSIISAANTMSAIGATETWLIISILILTLLSACFSAAETAYMSANRIRLKNIESNGSSRAKKVLKQLENPNRVLNTVLIGSNIMNITAASLATVLFTRLIVNNVSLSTTVSTVVMTFIVLLFSDMIPKTIAKEKAEKIAIFFQPFIMFWQISLMPIIWFFSLWRKIFKPKKSDPSITDDELITIIEEAESEGEIDSHESELIRSAIEFDDVELYDIMIPRVNIIAAEDTDSKEEISKIFQEHGFSRLPVYHDTIDAIIGILHEKDFNASLRTGKKITEVMRRAICLSRNMKISDALRTLQKAKSYMAVVVDEFGGTNGIVTMEDILEELVGEIYDEHDEEEVLFKQTANGVYVVSGLENLEDMFESLDIDVREEFESSSVGGWVTEQMKKIPTAGEKFVYKNLCVTVTKSNPRKVMEIKVEIIKDEDEENGDE